MPVAAGCYRRSRSSCIGPDGPVIKEAGVHARQSRTPCGRLESQKNRVRCRHEHDVSGKYATQYIPRSYVIGRDGKILFQTVGYQEEEFAQLVSAIEKELARKP